MADTVSFAHQQAWAEGYYSLAQQRTSRFARFTRDDGELMGKCTSRNQDTNIIDVPHSRRGCPLADYELGELIDPRDLHKLMDPQNAYVRNAVMAANRNRDSVILAAVNGSAVSADDDDTQTSNSLPNAQKVVVGGTGLTLAKLRSAREILRASEAVMPEDEEDLPFALSAAQMDDLLTVTEFKSRDYVDGSSMRKGRVAYGMGFVFIETELLSTDSSSSRLCLTWKPSAIGFRDPDSVNPSVDRRPDKGNAIQVYGKQSVGAVRIEDVAVVEVACAE
jgi:hypothetical protein